KFMDQAMDRTTGAPIYRATDGGFYKSEKGGAGWGQVSGPQPPVNPTRVLVDPQQPVNVYALIVPAVYKSPDAGKTWTRLSYPGFASRIAIAGSSPVTLYGYDFQGFNRSRDGGLVWNAVKVAPMKIGDKCDGS